MTLYGTKHNTFILRCFLQFTCTNLDGCQKEGGNFLNLLQKKGGTQKGVRVPTLEETMNKAVLPVSLQLLCTNLGDEILCVCFTVSPNHNIDGKNGVYQRWTTYALKSKSVLDMHIPMIWRSKFADLVNSKKNLNLWETTAVD